MATGEINGSDQRVTNALLAYKLDQLSAQLKQWHDDDCRQHEELTRRVTDLERGAATRQQSINSMEIDIADHDEAIADLRSKVAWWNGANSLAALVAGIVGWFK